MADVGEVGVTQVRTHRQTEPRQGRGVIGMLTAVEVELIVRMCRETATDTGTETRLEPVSDPLDGSLWIRFRSHAHARNALRALAELGLAADDHGDSRLHVTGWDPRLLRRRLGVLLAGVDDLRVEWEATAELAMYYHDHRGNNAGYEVGEWAALADVERALRTSIPFPRRAPQVADVDALLQLVDAAETAYAQLIEEHVEFAEQMLALYAAQLAVVDAATARDQVLGVARGRDAA
jgi:hypothetical protein